MLTRRSLLRLLGAGLTVVSLPTPARAQRSAAASLEHLVRLSRLIVVGTPVAGEGRWEPVGGRRRIVTYHRVRVDEVVTGTNPDRELSVRTLGGRVGKIGQIVHGAVRLRRGQSSVLFLRDLHAGVLVVTGMAQGHFPLVGDADGQRRLTISPYRGDLADDPDSAARRLSGQTLVEAVRRIQESRRRGE